jgi:hypothetical protein
VLNPTFHLWLPPRLIRRYQWAKALGGVVFASIFAGWMVIEWSSPVMRVLAGALIVVTLWVTVASVVIDAARARGRQVAVGDGRLDVTTPPAPGSAAGSCASVTLADVAYAQWRQDGDEGDGGPGLWFIGRDGRPLGGLDTVFLRDEAEARAFVGWLREHWDVALEVRWPRAEA